MIGCSVPQVHDKWINKVEEKLEGGRVEFVTMDNAKANRKAMRILQVGFVTMALMRLHMSGLPGLYCLVLARGKCMPSCWCLELGMCMACSTRA